MCLKAQLTTTKAKSVSKRYITVPLQLHLIECASIVEKKTSVPKGGNCAETAGF